MFKHCICLAAATLIVLSACTDKQKATDVLRVDTETVSASVVKGGSSYVGEVEAETTTPVSFTGMGTVTRVLVEEGQAVSRGQLLAQMDDTQGRNTLAGALAMQRQAKDAYARMKQLHDAQALSDIDWVETQSKCAQADAMVDAAKKTIADCNLKAPCAGIIGKDVMETGTTALPSQAVCSILNISGVKVKVSVPEKEIGHILLNTPSRISVAALGNRIYNGVRVEKGIQADAMTRTYDVRIPLNNADRQLLPGMVAQVSFSAQSEGEAITVPVRCVQEGARGDHFVWTVAGGKAHRTPVTLGAAVGNRMVVLDGLSTGDKVIVGGYQKVSEGSRVI